MPIGIGVNGGLLRQTALENVSSDKALGSLQQIRSHLSQPGRDSGVLTLFNRSSTDTEMTLERKSGLQLLFQKDDRLDDTVQAMKTLLKQAGKDDALVELDNYLSEQGGRQNRIESGKMFEILNHHLPPLEKGSSMENLRTLAKIETVKELGSGAFGSAYLARIDGKECVVKEFAEPQLLSLTRTARPNEAMGSYLTSKKEAYSNYMTDKVNISQPTLYMVSQETEGKREYQMVTPHQMRTLVKEARQSGTEVVCHGLAMPKARGQEVGKLIEDGTLTQSEKKQVIGSTLVSIKGLNERGFVHRDIKPVNTFFDKTSETSTLIDTGFLFKSSKNQDKNPGTESIQGHSAGSPLFMHPRALRDESHGTETDLYALGVMAMMVDHREAFSLLRQNLGMGDLENGFSRDMLSKRLDLMIKETDEPKAKAALEAFRRDLDDPKTLSGFAMDCFEMTALPAELWKERDFAQQTYSSLLRHPGLQ